MITHFLGPGVPLVVPMIRVGKKGGEESKRTRKREVQKRENEKRRERVDKRGGGGVDSCRDKIEKENQT